MNHWLGQDALWDRKNRLGQGIFVWLTVRIGCVSHQLGSREGSSDRTVRGTFAFGSSTPRILSHLCSRTGENGSNLEVGRRSYTTPTFSTSRSKTSTSTNARMKGTDKAIQKPSDRAASKSTCPISSTSYQSKERNEEIMNAVEMKLEVENDKVRPMNKIATKEQWKSEKVDGSESLAHLPEEALKKSSSLSAGFGNEEENVLLTKEPKSEITFPEGRKLSTAANAVEDDDSQLLLSTALTSTEKIKAEKIAKDSSGTEREREERRNIDESIHEHKIIYNNSYQPEAPVPQQCVKISEREERKSNDISVL
ncbi:unnamed protein product [Litomosoides sigmodontis]|uniref:Uncharacterized protein n=1 Tax=Litomosoides sigmodontis TaxID=42156 RepID=A0A3P6UGV4_LITSI|nr:unnamed protein product [Litomosoides sigmodontis]